jgi:hypothetical protein
MLFATGFADEELIFRRTAGVLAGLRQQLAVSSDRSFIAADRVLVELRDAQIALDPGDLAQAEGLELVRQRLRKRWESKNGKLLLGQVAAVFDGRSALASLLIPAVSPFRTRAWP